MQRPFPRSRAIARYIYPSKFQVHRDDRRPANICEHPRTMEGMTSLLSSKENFNDFSRQFIARVLLEHVDLRDRARGTKKRKRQATKASRTQLAVLGIERRREQPSKRRRIVVSTFILKTFSREAPRDATRRAINDILSKLRTFVGKLAEADRIRWNAKIKRSLRKMFRVATFDFPWENIAETRYRRRKRLHKLERQTEFISRRSQTVDSLVRSLASSYRYYLLVDSSFTSFAR